ncbi:YicC/YloC family endoribonuclease [Stappia sp. ES.058]|uniref:YicC/YloC family endoribonuclease n=1 Tax=Stappia sp. ES.058 TaxID=1881061 RepID=UPI001FCDFF90|nr:YicC/YloC family endoribonuclease [Stappia sp. ES.058]
MSSQDAGVAKPGIKTVLSSMTGFGRVDAGEGGARWTWELRSVNGKGLDVRLRLPSGLEVMESHCRETAAGEMSRGNVTVGLSFQRAQREAVPQINEAALNAFLAALETVHRRVPDAAPVALDGILAQRGIIEWKEPEEDPAERARLISALKASLAAALDALIAMRRSEGAAIETVLRGQLSKIARLTQAAEAAPSRHPEAIQARLAAQVEALLGTGAPLDVERLHQEAVLLATKADIREELDRLQAHVEAALALLDGGGAVGRRLDFLAQEFNREANTLCSKSNGTELTAIGLELKTVIDQMREQIQNLE